MLAQSYNLLSLSSQKKNSLFSIVFLSNVKTNSLFHTVKYKSRTVEQRIYKGISKNTYPNFN